MTLYNQLRGLLPKLHSTLIIAIASIAFFEIIKLIPPYIFKIIIDAVVDLDGAFVMPGIHDAHIHPPLVYTHEEAGSLLFPESLSAEEIQEVLRDFVASNPDMEFIRGEKWSTSLFPGGKAHRSFIDEVVDRSYGTHSYLAGVFPDLAGQVDQGDNDTNRTEDFA